MKHKSLLFCTQFNNTAAIQQLHNTSTYFKINLMNTFHDIAEQIMDLHFSHGCPCQLHRAHCLCVRNWNKVGRHVNESIRQQDKKKILPACLLISQLIKVLNSAACIDLLRNNQWPQLTWDSWGNVHEFCTWLGIPRSGTSRSAPHSSVQSGLMQPAWSCHSPTDMTPAGQANTGKETYWNLNQNFI